MTYANYGGYSYMGINRPALVRAFKDLRGQGFAARLGLSFNESYSMPSGAVWTEASDENTTWRQGTGDWQAQFGSYIPLAIKVSGELGGAHWTAIKNAGYVCRVLEIHGLHPFVDLDALTAPMQVVTIKLYPSTRMYEMTMADTEAQEHRMANLRRYQVSQEQSMHGDSPGDGTAGRNHPTIHDLPPGRKNLLAPIHGGGGGEGSPPRRKHGQGAAGGDAQRCSRPHP